MAKKVKQPEQNLIVSTSHRNDNSVEVSVSQLGSDEITLISIREPRAMYVTIGDKVVYIDYSLEELIVTSWANKD